MCRRVLCMHSLVSLCNFKHHFALNTPAERRLGATLPVPSLTALCCRARCQEMLPPAQPRCLHRRFFFNPVTALCKSNFLFYETAERSLCILSMWRTHLKMSVAGSEWNKLLYLCILLEVLFSIVESASMCLCMYVFLFSFVRSSVCACAASVIEMTCSYLYYVWSSQIVRLFWLTLGQGGLRGKKKKSSDGSEGRGWNWGIGINGK